MNHQYARIAHSSASLTLPALLPKFDIILKKIGQSAKKSVNNDPDTKPERRSELGRKLCTDSGIYLINSDSSYSDSLMDKTA